MTADDLAAAVGAELASAPLIEEADVRWRPSFATDDGSIIVYVVETQTLGKSIQDRIVRLLDAGRRVVVALPAPTLDLDSSSQEFLFHPKLEIITPDLVSLDRATLHDGARQLVMTAGLVLDDDLTRSLVARDLREAMSTIGTDRGPALERALGLACSQVPGWQIKELNLRTDNEELDVVIRNNSAQSPWNGSPYILVEAKNWSDNVDRVEYDAIHMKVKERGGFCRLGIFVATSGFSAGFYQRASHHGSEGFSIVPLTTGRMIERLENGVNMEPLLTESVERVVLDRMWEET